MVKSNIKTTRAIAYIGTILVWVPILFTLVTAAIATNASGILRLDYLIPAELFPLEIIGALLLLWASRRTKRYSGFILWSLVIMVGSLMVSQGAAVLTGLASGKTEATGWPFYLVVAFLVLYIAAVIAQCTLGLLLLKRLSGNN